MRSMAKHFLHAVFAASCVASAAPAAALTPSDIAGWWLSLDGELPAELLVVTADGAVENRRIQFGLVSAADCAKSKPCSDAPLTARSRLTLEGDKLQFGIHKSADGSPLPPITEAPTGTAALSAGNRLMTFRTGDLMRTAARIEPDRLRRLRAGLMTAGLPADRHWRCFLANATAGDVAFAPLHKGTHAAPAFLNDYLRIASYRASLAAMTALATADDPDPARRAVAGTAVETLLAERFKDVDTPRTAADVRRYRAQGAVIDQRGRGVSPQEANVVATALNGGSPVTVIATGAEFSALTRVVMRDAEAKRLLCAE